MKILRYIFRGIFGILLIGYLGWAWVENTKVDQASSSSESSKTVLVGTEGTYEPFSYYDADNKLVGYDVDVARAVFKYLDMKVEFVDAPWDSMLAAFNSGKTDVVFNQVGITAERTQKYAMTRPYSYSHAVLIVEKNNTNIHGFADLKGKRSAQSLTSNYGQQAKDLGATIVSTDGFSKSADLISQDRADATINDDVVFYSYLKSKPNAPLKVVTKQTKGIATGAMLKKNNKKLAKQIDRAIKHLQENGTLSKISKKYFGKDISKD